jgi:mono/diheme cytochrome c family protein
MITRKLACPSCNVRLKVDETLPVGKSIRCPNCRNSFTVPAANGDSPPARPKKAEPPPEPADDPEEKGEERPARRKFRKKKKSDGKGALVLALAIVGLLAAGGALTFAIIYKRPNTKPDTVARADQKTDSVAAGNPMMAMRGGQSAEMRPDFGNMPQPMAASQSQPGMGTAMPAVAMAAKQGAGGSQTGSAGRNVFDAHNCQRCHSIGDGDGMMAGGGRRRNKGPDLSHVGRDSSHTVAWLMDHVRDPKSHRPNSRMPPYGDKMSDQELKFLAEYLASLK